jgi:4-hydroxy-2-oxoheptanedioate aldolase
VPHVNTADNARRFVEAAKFPPIGRRGMFMSRQAYGVDDYLQIANDHTLLIALIEDIRAVQNLDEILEVEHIDVVFVAPADLAASMGLMGLIGQVSHLRMRSGSWPRAGPRARRCSATRTASTTPPWACASSLPRLSPGSPPGLAT